LLVGITLNKLRGQIERHASGKRSIGREGSADLDFALGQAAGPAAADVAAIADEWRLAIDSLNSDERKILSATIQRQSVEQISRESGESARTIRRLVANVRRKIEARLLAAEAPLTESEAPLRYADYVLEKLLGAGGMGKVFRAREKGSGKTVAIKALHKSRQAEKRAVERFVQEAKILGRLRHPNIVGVRGLGRFPGGGYFLVMDHVDGVDLQTRLKSGLFSWSDTVRIVTAVASAIQYAHDRGVVHCDLKPANVLLDASGRVFVTDFGFAFLVAADAVHCGIGGTAGYIAPELLLGQSLPTPAADIYALGKLTWMLVAGAPFPEGDIFDRADERRAAIFDICKRCTASDPKERYESPREFVDALRVIES
jgi:serine/threonine protein kinase